MNENIIKNIKVERFSTNPLITPETSSTIGNNINGASVIRVPYWVENPLGKYYMYFAHHSGSFIRLAYSNAHQGPWTIYEPGTLQLKDAQAFHNHIASPDVHVDEETKQIRMYFHGPVRKREGQWTGVATSANGIEFSASQEILGKFYFRVWFWNENWYAIAKNNNEGWGELYQSKDGITPFKSRGDFLRNMRHAAVLVQDQHLLVFYSRVGDEPERILLATVDMRPNWLEWIIMESVEILQPSVDYEGVSYPIIKSENGSAVEVRQLRDPCVCVDDGHLWMFYSGGGGEMNICGAVIEMGVSQFNNERKSGSVPYFFKEISS